MFKNYYDFDRAKTNWILKCADDFKEELKWEGLNLRPAFIRYLFYALFSLDKKWLEKNIFSQIGFQDILLNLQQHQKSWKSRANRVPGFLNAKYKVKWLGYRSKKITKEKPLIAVGDWKHAYYLKRSKLFNELDPLWLVDSPQMAKEIGLNEEDLIVPHIRPFLTSKSRFPINFLHDLANGLKISLERSRPSAIFVVEGDAPYHSMLAEIGRMLDIPVYCFQWGFFHPTELSINFGEMQFNKFISWGPIFEEQLKPFNPQQDFISFGHLTSNSLSRMGNKIIFLSQYVIDYITEADQELLVKLATSLAERFPNQVVWRPHPSAQENSKELLELKNSKVHLLDPRDTLGSHLEDSVVAIGIGSSSLIDALYCGVIPICFNTTCMDYPFPLVKQGVGFEFRSFNDALSQIIDLMTNQKKIRSLQNQIAIKHSTFFTKTELHERIELIQMLCKNK